MQKSGTIPIILGTLDKVFHYPFPHAILPALVNI